MRVVAPFHIVVVGVSVLKFCKLMRHVQAECGYRVSYVVASSTDVHALLANGVSAADVRHIDERLSIPAPSAQDIEYLANLERGEVPTVHNMIQSDPVISKLPYADALAYAAHLARGFRSAFSALQPSVVIGGHDRMHSSMGFGVAKAEGFPWFCTNFSAVPIGLVGLSLGIFPDELVHLRDRPAGEAEALAVSVLTHFEQRRLKAPAYVSAYNLALVANRFRHHGIEAVRSLWARSTGRFDRYNDYSVWFKAKQYIRKRKNMLRLPHAWFIAKPPAEPFLFFGLHMQPESTPDVYAPFFANQFDVIEKIARAMPPTHQFLVKLHISDADNYSRKQLRSLLRLPGVQLVLPNVSSREFIDNCDAVVTIAGTIGLEAALLGKPVIIFGKMNYNRMPSVERVGDIYDLPALIRRALSRPKPKREAIIAAFAKHLSDYFETLCFDAPVRTDDWTLVEPAASELKGFVDLFQALADYLARAPEASSAVAP